MSSPKGGFTTGPRRTLPSQGRAFNARARRLARRKRRMRFLVGGVFAVVAGAALTAGPAVFLHMSEGGQRADAAPEDVEVLEPAADQPQQRLLLVTIEGPEGPATSVTLLAGPSGEVPASALFLPSSTLVSIPGFGMDLLGSAHRYGGADLIRAAVENALSIHVDQVATVTESAFAEFLGRAGDVTVHLPERVVERHEDGSATVRFERGEQTLSGRELVSLWLVGTDTDELDSFRRRQQVLERVLAEAGDPQVRDRLVADGAPQLRTGAGASWLREFFEDLAAAQAGDELRFNLLPVERFGTAGPDGRRAFRIHQEDTSRLVGSVLGGEQDVASSGAVRVQVLNGVGRPGVGQLVDELIGHDVRLVLTGNANHFEHQQTRLLIYEESRDALEAAHRVQEQLGVGTIQVSRQPQSIVDLTIVVGADLMGPADGPTDGSESAD